MFSRECKTLLVWKPVVLLAFSSFIDMAVCVKRLSNFEWFRGMLKTSRILWNSWLHYAEVAVYDRAVFWNWDFPRLQRRYVRRRSVTLYKIGIYLIGGLAQSLKHQSLAGGLSLIHAWSMVDMWPPVSESTNHANSDFYPSGVGKRVVMITGVETIKRQAIAMYGLSS